MQTHPPTLRSKAIARPPHVATLPVLDAKGFGAHGMTDAEKAYQIAEPRIARAQAEGLAYLCLAETPEPDDPVKWDKEEALKHLATIPPSISSLTELKRLDLDNTQVTDLSPLAGMVAMQTLNLTSTQVDLSGLVAPGAAWERENHKLTRVGFKGVPVEDEVLATLGEKSMGAPETLARLRELRDMAPPPAAPQDREDGARLDLDEEGALTLSNASLGDADQDDLSEELQDACAALSAKLLTNNQFAHTRGRSDRCVQ